MTHMLSEESMRAIDRCHELIGELKVAFEARDEPLHNRLSEELTKLLRSEAYLNGLARPE